MKCPKCGSEVRPSKKYPGDYLCDKCKIRYRASSVLADNTDDNTVPRKKKHPFLIIFLVLLLLVAAAAGAYYSGLISFEEPAVPQALVIDAYSKDETASLNGTEIKILSLESSAGNFLVKPANGNTILLVNVQITNTSENLVKISNMTNFKAYFNEEELLYNASLYEMLSDEQPRLAGELNPGSSINGYLCYEVPADWSSFKLEYMNPVWSLHKIQFDIDGI